MVFVYRQQMVEMELVMPLMNVLKEAGLRVEIVQEVMGCAVYVSWKGK